MRAELMGFSCAWASGGEGGGGRFTGRGLRRQLGAWAVADDPVLAGNLAIRLRIGVLPQVGEIVRLHPRKHRLQLGVMRRLTVGEPYHVPTVRRSERASPLPGRAGEQRRAQLRIAKQTVGASSRQRPELPALGERITSLPSVTALAYISALHPLPG